MFTNNYGYNVKYVVYYDEMIIINNYHLIFNYNNNYIDNDDDCPMIYSVEFFLIFNAGCGILYLHEFN